MAKTDKVRLHNQGKRTIFVGPGQGIKPNTIAMVTPDVAKKHLRLYPKELIDLDNIAVSVGKEAQVKDFTGDADESAEPEKAAADSPAVSPAAASARRGGRRKAAAGDDELADALKDE